MSSDCPVCYEVIGDTNSTTTSCGHHFHTSCLIRSVMSVNNLCPCCRHTLVETSREPEPVLEPVQSRFMTHDELVNLCLSLEVRYFNFIDKFFKITKSPSVRRKANIYISQDEFEYIYNEVLKLQVQWFWIEIDSDEASLNRVRDNILYIVENKMTRTWNDAKKAFMKTQREIREQNVKV
jgi:hypothetical protein